jgi:cytochrome c biogenesis protein CcdA/thiol-disulfide isomerase/thioredoxin
MALLLAFALLAGAGTALSPCVLPVLPALLASASAGGKRRPLGVVLGLSVTFTVTIVGIAKVVGGVGLGSDPLRLLAVFVLLAGGLALMVPALGDRLEARLSRIAALGAGGGRMSRGDGFASGLVVGAALGFVYTPCAGPILAAVISVGAATGRTVAIAIAYSAGSALVLLLLALGGRSLFDRVRAAGRGPALQRALGAIMVLTAVAILTNVDVRFDQYIAQHIPNFNLTASLEGSHAVQSRLSKIDGRQQKFLASDSTPMPKGLAHDASQATLLAAAEALPVLGPAPEFSETEDWFNTGAGGHSNHPLSMSGLRGHVVLIDFWTYTCINCLRTLPYLEAWSSTYGPRGLVIVGVHTPEFAFEHEASNVAEAIRRLGIRYPVVQDNEYGTWNAYGNQSWPADYLVDASGQVRYAAIGEGDYDKTESAIRALLAEAGARVGAMSHPTGAIAPSLEATPETYLGTARAQGWVNVPKAGVHDYGAPPAGDLPLNEFAYSGTWNIAAQPALAMAGAGIDAEVQAKNVYLVLASKDHRPRRMQVLLDGHPISAAQAGADVHNGSVTVTDERLYSLVSLSSNQRHRLSLRLASGITGYSFTFG